MRTIGLLGGLTYVSTIDYYQRINEAVSEVLGKRHSAKIILNSIDYQEVKQFNNEDWDGISELVKRELLRLSSFGVDCLMVCNNTLHKAVDKVLPDLDVKVPFFHIVDCIGEAAKKHEYKRILLLGTQFTMEDGFYSEKLKNKYQLDVIVPEQSDRQLIHNIIMNELVKNVCLEESKQKVLQIIDANDCDAVALSCTELPLLIKPDDCSKPLLNSVEIHCAKAIEFALMS